tara:strand:+ start:93403 stop:94458 length:1056 start_codon:yes stop_codon:yes gene_type:complete
MSWPYQLFKSFAFGLDAEKAHNLSIKFLSKFPHLASEIFGKDDISSKKLECSVSGMNWSFPVGLAAGLDKNAEAIDFFAQTLFGAVEVGTVTPLAQSGNPKPRMFRLKEELSLLNRMGFNNSGMDIAYENILNSTRHGKVLGVNLGKNKVTTEEDAPSDYQKLFDKFSHVADYLVVNVSSPNTPGLRDLQNINSLKLIFDELKKCNNYGNVPLFLKISPDLAIEDLDGVVTVASDYGLSGLIATNTTIMPERGQGGISGNLLKERSRTIRHELLKRTNSTDLGVIGVGGIDSFEEVWQFLIDGGDAVQIYTSFIYQGPEILNKVKQGLESKLEQYKASHLKELLSNRDQLK